MKRVLGLMMVLAMLVGVMPTVAYAGGTLEANVDFDENYIFAGENSYIVFGRNNSNETKTLQTVRALYTNGALVDVTYGASFSVAAGEEFSRSEAVNIPNSADISNSSLKVYVWDGESNYSPVTKEFSKSGARFSFTLSEGATTSAGVYDGDVLIRTLWSAVYYEAGEHSAVWDGLDDEQRTVAAGNYTVKIASNNVKYEIDTVLANSTAFEKASTVMSSYRPMSDMTLLGDNMYYADQYMENYYTLMYFNINDIHHKAGYFEKRGNRVPIRNANDGETVYWLMFETTPTGTYNAAGSYDTSVYGQRRAFIMGVDASENTQVIYEYGQSLWDYWGANSATTYQSAIGYEPYFESEGVGHYDPSSQVGYGDISVQKSGNFLAVTYGGRDFVRIIDKTTGKTLKDNSLKAPTAVIFDTQDRLWAAYKDESGNYAISRFDISSDGTITLKESVPQNKVKGETLAIAFNPSGTYMAVVFGEGENKLYAYNLSDWSEKWSFGNGTNYTSDTTVYDDKFMFHDLNGGKDYSFLEFQGEDYLWVGDPGNDRNHKLLVSGEGTPQIADTLWFSRQHYPCEIDANDSTRVFFGSKEYKIDYQKDGAESWTLVANYLDTIAGVVTENTAGMLHGITTASNGKTYFAAVLTTAYGTHAAGDKVIFELADGHLRDTGVSITGWELLSDGKMTLQIARGAQSDGVSGTGLFRKSLKGFDASGNPMWNDEEMIAFMSTDKGKWNKMSSNTAVSENGIVFPVNEDLTKQTAADGNIRDFKMGGFYASTSGDNDWLFKTAPATPKNYIVRTFPRDGAVLVWTWYGLSGEAKAYGDNVITHYRGEGVMSGGQSNIFYHYLDNGLLVGVFGESIRQQAKVEEYDEEVVNGNGFCWQMTFPFGKDSDTAYIYQGGEARLSGAVKWKVTGLNSIKTQEIPVTVGDGYRSGVLTTVYNSGNFALTSETSRKVQYDFSLPSGVSAEQSVKFETYLKAPEGEEELELWVYSDGNIEISYDNVDVISGSGIVAASVKASHNEYKKLTVSLSAKDGALSYFELKTDIDGKKVDVPVKYLYANSEVADRGVIKYNLLGDLPFDSNLSGVIGAWNFENWLKGTSTAVTNAGSYDYTKGASLTLNGALLYGDNIWASCDLGSAGSLSAWEIDTEFRMLGVPNGYYTYPSSNGGKSGKQEKYFDILDSAGKVIARITFEDDYTLKLNGKTIMQTDSSQESLSRTYIHELSTPSELKIYVSNGNVTATYRGNSVTASVYESGANWASPQTVKVSAYKDCRHGPHAVTMTTELLTLDYIKYR